MCSEHPEQEAMWQCDSCQKIFCNRCVTIRHYGRERLETCGLCGGRCQLFGQAKVRDEKKKSFFSKLPGAFIYPFKGEGKVMLLIGVIFYEILRILSLAPFVGGIIGFIGLGYFAAYMLKILTASITGKEWMPELPDLTELYNEIISPYLSVILVTFVSFAPAVLFLVLSLVTYPANGRERVSLKSRLQQISEFKNISCKDDKVKKVRSGIKPGSRIAKYSKKYAASGISARKTIEKKKEQLSRSRFYYGLTLFFLIGGLLYYPMALTAVGMESFQFYLLGQLVSRVLRFLLRLSRVIHHGC